MTIESLIEELEAEAKDSVENWAGEWLTVKPHNILALIAEVKKLQRLNKDYLCLVNQNHALYLKTEAELEKVRGELATVHALLSVRI
jgi:hypothetical protein